MSAKAPTALALALGGLVAVTAPARPAEACGGGGDGGSSSGGSSSGGSSSGGGGGYEGSAASEPACVDGTTVVGYRMCSPYGTWGTVAQLPKVSFELGPWTSMVDLHDLAVSGSVSHSDGTRYAYRVVGSDLGGQADVVGLRSRLLLHRGGTYLGLEGGVGGIVADGDRLDRQTPMDRVDLVSRTAMAASGGVVVGGRVFSGRLSLGGEVMAGLRAVGVASTSTHGACVVEDVHWSGEPTIELRAKGDLWLSPWLTAGAYLGRDALGGQTSAGLNLGFHVRAFDGH